MSFDRSKAMRNAERHIAQGKLRAAIAEYKSVVDHDPKDISTLNMLGDLYSKNAEKNEAVRCYTLVAEHYSKQGFAAKAIAVYKKISKLRPDSMEVSEKLAELYKSKGSVSEAKSHYTILAENYQNKGLKMEALAIWKQIAVLDPGNTQVYLNIAESYRQEQQRDEAADAFTEGGKRFANCGQNERAADCFSNALDLKATHAGALAGFVDSMNCLGKMPEAIERVESVAKEAPHDLNILLLLADCYLQQQNASKAEQAVIKLFEKEQENYPKLLEVARLYLNTEDATGGARVLSLCSENMLVGGKADEFRGWVDEILAKEPKHLSALRLLACHCSWMRDSEALRLALETMADAAFAECSVEDERYALSQLAMIVPQETAFADRLREINEEHGFSENPYDEAILKYQFEDQELSSPEEASVNFGALIGGPVDEIAAEPVSNNGKHAETSDMGAAVLTSSSGNALAADLSDADSKLVDAGIGDLLEGNGSSKVGGETVEAQGNTLTKDLESIEFYLESGYNELAETTLKELRSEHGDLPEFDKLAGRVAAAIAAASDPEGAQQAFPAQTIELEEPVSSQAKRFDLDEIRSEFGLEEIDQADNDDYETRYQMAIAYQEMGLMEEAIKEYQDAINCVSPSDGTRRFFQCANLLGHCFMQNGMAKLALKWYNRALEAANLTDDEKQGIWYEIAAAYEADGDTSNAARYYEQVYAENVDYRNVGERIRNLTVHA